MGTLITGIVIALITAALPVGAVFIFRKKFVGASQAEQNNLLKEIETLDKKLADFSSVADAYASSKQIEFVQNLLTETEQKLNDERTRLKEVEARLDVQQKAVEQKEGAQQEVKASKDEDEVKLEQLLNEYQQNSDEAIALERNLAASMKNLENIIAQVPMTDEQKRVLNELLTIITEAGSRMRELVVEYQSNNERLVMLQQQHRDLEDEYTRLVEQQLGG